MESKTMQMKSFIKNNFIIISGITLPILLMAFLYLSKNNSDSLVPAPEYKVVYLNNYNIKYEIKIKNNKLHFCQKEIEHIHNTQRNEYSLHKEINNGFSIHNKDFFSYINARVKLHIYNQKSNNTDIFTIGVLENILSKAIRFDNGETCVKILYPIELRKIDFIEGKESPDNYQMKNYNNYNSGPMDLFASGNNKYLYSLVKDGRYIKIPNANGYRAKHIGWTK